MAAGRIIAVSVDGSASSDNALSYYLDNLKKEGDKLYLIHIPEHFNFTDISPGVLRELMHDVKTKTAKLQKKYREMLESCNVDFKFKIGEGEAGDQIVKIAESVGAELLVCGSRGHGWLRRTVLGSVSSFILHHTSIPVLICKPKEHQSTK